MVTSPCRLLWPGRYWRACSARDSAAAVPGLGPKRSGLAWTTTSCSVAGERERRRVARATPASRGRSRRSGRRYEIIRMSSGEVGARRHASPSISIAAIRPDRRRPRRNLDGRASSRPTGTATSRLDDGVVAERVVVEHQPVVLDEQARCPSSRCRWRRARPRRRRGRSIARRQVEAAPADAPRPPGRACGDIGGRYA